MEGLPDAGDLKFEWDPQKAGYNLRAHGVSFEAATVFNDPFIVTVPDVEHSEVEDRGFTIGQSDDGHVLAVSWTLRGDDVIRIISARRATRRERLDYNGQT